MVLGSAMAGEVTAACSPQRLSPVRFYVLGLYFYLMANQCLIWFTFSSVPDLVPRYYCGGRTSCEGMSVGVVDLLLNWGPISFVPVAPFASWMLSFPGGLRRAMRLAALLSFLATLLRMVPCWVPAGSDAENAGIFWLLHVAQILNGISGPILIAGPSRLSAIWFPPEQRTLATAVANASFFGAAAGFMVGPAITAGDPSRLPVLLLATLVISLPPLLCVGVYCPARPAVLPSAAVESAWDLGASGSPSSARGFMSRATIALVRRPAVGLMMLATFFGIGVYDGWIGLLPQILEGYAPAFAGRPNLAGACGAVSTVCCLLGMWVAGVVADRCFERRLKALLLILAVAAALVFAWIALALSTRRGGTGVLPSGAGSLFVAVSLASFFRTATVPVLYELAAEATYPEPEGTSAGMICVAEHAALLCVLFLAPHVDVSCITWATLVSLCLCPLALLAVREEYRRKDADAAVHLRSALGAGDAVAPGGGREL